MTLQQALGQLGVRDDTLTAAEKAQLDTEGYVLLQGILSADEVAGVGTVTCDQTGIFLTRNRLPDAKPHWGIHAALTRVVGGRVNTTLPTLESRY